MAASEQKIIDCGTDAVSAVRRCCTPACSCRRIRPPTFTFRCPTCGPRSSASTATARSTCSSRCASRCRTIRRKPGIRLPPAGDDGARRWSVQDNVQARPGDEVTVVVEETQATAVIQESSQNSLAPWHVRAGAFAVDVLPGIAVVATMALVSFTCPAARCVVVGMHVGWRVAILLVLVNRLVLPTVTGWSLGRAVCGIAVVGRDGAVHRGVAAAAAGSGPPARHSCRCSWDGFGRCGIHVAGPSRTCCCAPRRDAPKPKSGRADVRRWTAAAVLTCACCALRGRR